MVDYLAVEYLKPFAGQFGVMDQSRHGAHHLGGGARLGLEGESEIALGYGSMARDALVGLVVIDAQA